MFLLVHYSKYRRVKSIWQIKFRIEKSSKKSINIGKRRVAKVKKQKQKTSPLLFMHVLENAKEVISSWQFAKSHFSHKSQAGFSDVGKRNICVFAFM